MIHPAVSKPARGKAFLLVLALVGANAAWAEDTLIREEHLVLTMGGSEVGTADSADYETAGGYRLERKSTMKLKRGKTLVDIETVMVAETDAALQPITYTFSRTDASGTLTLRGRRDGTRFVVTTEGGPSAVDKSFELERDMMFASAAQVLLWNNRRVGFETKRKVIVEEMGAVTPFTASVKARDGGGVVVTSSFDNLGLVTHDELDGKGKTVVSRTPAIGAVAYPVGSKPPEGVGTQRLDMLGSTRWPAPDLPEGVERVVYRVRVSDAATFKVPEDDRQRVLKREGGTMDLEVKSGPAMRGILGGAERRRLLESTPYEPVNDPLLKETALKVTLGATTPAEKVQKLVTFVSGHIEDKAMDRAYAPALVTLESKAGDCTEHAVLLSALARSLGIPTRLVDGVIVDGGHVGYHEWVEVYIDGEGFIPADPMFGEFPASPARLKLTEGTSSPEGLLKLGVAAGRMLRAGTSIEVVESTPAFAN